MTAKLGLFYEQGNSNYKHRIEITLIKTDLVNVLQVNNNVHIGVTILI